MTILDFVFTIRARSVYFIAIHNNSKNERH
jgi:hypothetical protein